MSENFLWIEKYRPKTIEECILPHSYKAVFQQYLDVNEIPNFLLSGSAGIGKTTVARALCEQLGADVLFINGSMESGIDVLRTKIQNFASTISLTDSPKVVILDESDYLNPNSMQPALRGFMDEFSSNCRFIFTCNFKNRIIEPLHSRCTNIDFKIPTSEKAQIQAQFFKRIISILDGEGIDYDKKVVAELVHKFFPDFRRTLNELQSYSVSGKIDSGILVNASIESFRQLFKLMAAKNFTEVRKWVALNADGDSTRVFRELYDQAADVFEPSSVPALVVLLADYSYKSAFVVDHELNMMACFTEIMGGCKFK